MTTEQRGNYETVQNKFKEYYTGKINVIYERAKFNSRKQEPDEPVNDFITALNALSEHCAFETLREELIRDRISVGLKDAKLSERATSTTWKPNIGESHNYGQTEWNGEKTADWT